MVADGSGEIGAAKLTSEVLQIMNSVPLTVKNMTGVDISATLSRGGLGASRVSSNNIVPFSVMPILKLGLYNVVSTLLSLPVAKRRGHWLLHVVEGWGRHICFSHGFWDIWLLGDNFSNFS